MDPVAMELVGIRIELPSNVPILLLRESEGVRYLPIWIGPNEATAIALALQGVEPQRPMTHDLLKLVIESLEADVVRVDVTKLVDGTFFANLVVDRQGTEPPVPDRPCSPTGICSIVPESRLKKTGRRMKSSASVSSSRTSPRRISNTARPAIHSHFVVVL